MPHSQRASSRAARTFTRCACLVLACSSASAGWLCAQTPAKSAATPGSIAGQGFSIESEMLTYRALQSNSEAIACDVAAYLYHQPRGFTNAAGGSTCGVMANANVGVVLLPFDQDVIAGLQLWRADLAIMDELRQRTLSYCPATPAIEFHERGTAATAGAAASTIAGFTPAGAALSLAQTAFGMIATQAETSSVAGTIQDQAFLNGVSRQLRVIGVSVLTPQSYRPYTLNGLDVAKSPFLTSLGTFLVSHDCMQSKDDGKDNSVTEILGEMNSFLATLNGGASPTARSAQSPGAAATGSGGSAQPATGPTATPSSTSNLPAILLADGLAQRLGVDPATAKLTGNGEWQHILFLKALESGGTITRDTNIFGTRIRYSGGSVGTYSLVTLEGDLECSGNVFDFGGSVKAKNFQKELRHYTPDPASQLIFKGGGGCSQVKR